MNPQERQDGDDDAAFIAAWHDFASECADTVAPEATYQAWLAHFAIQRLGVLRVVREVDFGARHLLPEASVLFSGHNLMVDVVLLRKPIVQLPRRAVLADPLLPDGSPNPKSGLQRLADFSVISELKVGATQMEGLDMTEVVRDFQKLSAILNAAKGHYPDHPLPAAFVGILDNHPRRRFNVARLRTKLAELDIGSEVRPLIFTGDGPVPS